MNCIIIGGFLGSGKTTFINYLLKHSGDFYPGMKTALLINEFGETAVDAAMMDAGNYSMREITGGCICCTLKGILADAVAELKEKEAPDLIIVEATGLAVPSEIASSIGQAGGCSVFTQLCVDPDQYARLAGRLAIYDRQLADADMLLLTKKDVRNSVLFLEVAAVLKGDNNMRRCFNTNDVAAQAVYSCFKEIYSVRVNKEVKSGHQHHHEKHGLKQDICQHTHRFTGLVELPVLEKLLVQIFSAAGPELFRIKGIVDTTAGRKAVQFTEGEMSVRDLSSSADGESFVVFIGSCSTIEGVKADLERISLPDS